MNFCHVDIATTMTAHVIDVGLQGFGAARSGIAAMVGLGCWNDAVGSPWCCWLEETKRSPPTPIAVGEGDGAVRSGNAAMAENEEEDGAIARHSAVVGFHQMRWVLLSPKLEMRWVAMDRRCCPWLWRRRRRCHCCR
ncbi:hypothetical protein ACLOJK_028365 [Asimina triloba]